MKWNLPQYALLVRPWLPWLLPVLVAWAGYSLAVRPLLAQGDHVQACIMEVRATVAASGGMARAVDSLRTVREDLRHLEDSLRGVAGQTLPGPDSIAELARSFGLAVDGMEVTAPERGPAGTSRRLRLVAAGPALTLTKYLDALRTASPRLRLERATWEHAGAGFALRPLELRLWDSFAPVDKGASSDSLLTLYLRHARHKGLGPLDSAALVRLFGSPPPLAPVRTAGPGVAHAPVVSPPMLTITGLVAGRMANCVDAKGNRVLLKVGVNVGGWTVESIDARSVTLSHGDARHVLQGR